MKMLYANSPEVICFDGEEDDDDAAAAAAAASANEAAEKLAADEAAAKADREKKFSQEEVNKMVTKRNKALDSQFKSLESNYQTLLQQQNLSAEQREKLEKDLENVQTQLRSKEQQAAHERKKAEEAHKSVMQKVEQERDHFKNLFESTTIERAIADAAIENEGFNTEIFVALLAPKAKIVDEVDKMGQKTGRLVPQVSWGVKSDDGTTTLVQRSPKEIVELMKDDKDNYGNMFRPNVARGVGQGTAPGQSNVTSGSVNQKKISDEEYARLRETPEGRKAMGLTR